MREKLKAFLVLVFMIFSFPSISLSKSERERLEDGEIIVERKKIGDVEGVILKAIIDAPIEVVWKVATDYENFEEFMPHIEEHKILHREKDIVYTNAVLKILFVKVAYNLKHKLEIGKDKMVDCWEHATGKYEYKGKNPVEFKKNYGCWTFERYDKNRTKTIYEPYVEFKILESVPDTLKRKIEDILIKMSAPEVIQATRKRAKEIMENN